MNALLTRARELGGTLEKTLAGLLPQPVTCALVGFPNHQNVGDSAIWVGEDRYLKQRGIAVNYVCDAHTYARRRMAASLGDGVILMHGGGNLGDVWPEHQHLRERVIADFPHNVIIQLPQTIYFRDRANLDRAGAVLNRHPNLTILARDLRSLQIARKHFAANSILCPDMALALGALARSSAPSCDVFWLRRTDCEAADYVLPADDNVRIADWLKDDATIALLTLRWL